MKRLMGVLLPLLCIAFSGSLFAQGAGCPSPLKGIRMVAIPAGTFQMGQERHGGGYIR